MLKAALWSQEFSNPAQVTSQVGTKIYCNLLEEEEEEEEMHILQIEEEKIQT